MTLAAAAALVVLRCAFPGAAPIADTVAVPVVLGTAAAAVLGRDGPSVGLGVVVAVCVAYAGAVAVKWPFVHSPGAMLLLGFTLVIVAWLCWMPGFLLGLPISVTHRVLLALLFSLLLLGVPAAVVTAAVELAVLRRDVWSRAHPPSAPVRTARARASIHLACYNEPPELVIGTLDALARLGRRFRFLHVDPLSGAKAGALNVALARTSAQARIVTVVDAHNQVTPDFLARLVGHFDDPGLGSSRPGTTSATGPTVRSWSAASGSTGSRSRPRCAVTTRTAPAFR